jgi:hypothetical protein
MYFSVRQRVVNFMVYADFIENLIDVQPMKTCYYFMEPKSSSLLHKSPL